ncbi:MAG: C4-dicarboxylic acid transporter DauA [Chlamydiia bacterium]|nr:C4-dicarboxylic acid transporter DauA [Chlamydiia bacterium]MCH9615278.1 C4-dicarboxylic acid transporter DauA [Chlamydiia bacterium]MCH9628400.1 C4-dicarboxylic acid transporter DauA [Chlamydiia bacterium]
MLGSVRNYLLPIQGKWTLDIFSGLTVALALIPESIAFALVAHLDPLVGLYSAFFLCLITALFGGRPGMISGATGAMAVVIVSLVVKYGVSYVFATIVLTGILQVLIGVFRLGKFIRILPKSVMVGFVNGLAIVIFLAQLEQFKVHVGDQVHWLSGMALYSMIGLVILAMGVTHFLPRLTKRVPGALVAIILVTAIVHLLGVDARVVQDMMGGKEVSAGLPQFAWLKIPLTWASLKITLPYAITLCIIGLSESLMTLSLIDEMTHTRGRANKECIAQGAANIVCGFFQGMGGCTMLGQSMININSGGRGRISGIIAGCTLFLFILVLWPMIKLIPLAALVGVMFMVVIETFEWATFKFLGKIPLHDAFVIVIVTLVTVFTNLAIAVVTGVVIAALVFAWQTAKNIHAQKKMNKDGAREYHLQGPLFFGSVTQFKAIFDVENDPKEIIIDFLGSRVTDHSAIHAIQFITERYVALGKNLHLRHLSPECKLLLGKAGDMVETNVLEDPDYHVASNKLG